MEDGEVEEKEEGQGQEEGEEKEEEEGQEDGEVEREEEAEKEEEGEVVEGEEEEEKGEEEQEEEEEEEEGQEEGRRRRRRRGRGEKEGGRRKVKLIKLTIDSWPEELSTHGVYRWNMMRLHVAVINWSNRWWFPTWIIPKKGTFVILILSGIHSLALDEYTLISVP